MNDVIITISTIALFPAVFYICIDWITKLVQAVKAKKKKEIIRWRVSDLILEAPVLIFFISFFAIWQCQ